MHAKRKLSLVKCGYHTTHTKKGMLYSYYFTRKSHKSGITFFCSSFFSVTEDRNLTESVEYPKRGGNLALTYCSVCFSVGPARKNLYRTLDSGREPQAPSKDAVYRVLNNAT